MTLNYETLNPKYIDNTRLWLRDLYKHRAYVKEMILGEEGEWRQQLEFILRRTDEAIEEVSAKLVEEKLEENKNV